MITINDIEYEPRQSKIFNMGPQALGLFAGDMQLHARIAPKAFTRSELQTQLNGRTIIAEIAEIYAEEFADYRRIRAERQYLAPLNLNVDSFLRKQQDLIQEIAFDLTNKMLNAEIASEAIIAGIDKSGPHVFKIHDPGLSTCFDTPFFAAIGIGENHATSQFMLAKFEKRWSLEKTLFLTYAAKTRAEAAAGVGKQTDMAIIRPDKPIYGLTKADLGKLDQCLRAVNEKERIALDETYAEIREYFQNTAKDTPRDPPAPPPEAPKDPQV
jgi:hypothetical protein